MGATPCCARTWASNYCARYSHPPEKSALLGTSALMWWSPTRRPSPWSRVCVSLTPEDNKAPHGSPSGAFIFRERGADKTAREARERSQSVW